MGLLAVQGTPQSPRLEVGGDWCSDKQNTREVFFVIQVHYVVCA